jgi:hypothetical protein
VIGLPTDEDADDGVEQDGDPPSIVGNGEVSSFILVELHKIRGRKNAAKR